ncbi:hypothetical protein A7K69_16055 [Parageobacillus thermoglucosidasius]|uniref:Uncharacterized protein n=1 Tax=Parageobacillus thermoglucosidasius TaxID=1426 RepID=A0A1B7KVD8_PARTM|nr:hypothetical protein A7K69_16055 [Parageobacillus thermoglucosidasius]
MLRQRRNIALNGQKRPLQPFLFLIYVRSVKTHLRANFERLFHVFYLWLAHDEEVRKTKTDRSHLVFVFC